MLFKHIAFIIINSVLASHKHLHPKIVGGILASIQELPYQVSLQYYRKHFCGGSIISQNWVLSAAHCMEFPQETLTVYAGSPDLNNRGYHYNVDLLIVHENFDKKWFVADLALIKVTFPFQFSQSIQSIQLFNQDEQVMPYQLAVTSGWGEGNRPAHLLHKVQLHIVDKKTCALAYWINNLPTGQICAGFKNERKDSCTGDSGGPLVVNNRLAGVVSWGMGCGLPNIPGVYAEVGAFRNWIGQNMKRHTGNFYYDNSSDNVSRNNSFTPKISQK